MGKKIKKNTRKHSEDPKTRKKTNIVALIVVVEKVVSKKTSHSNTMQQWPEMSQKNQCSTAKTRPSQNDSVQIYNLVGNNTDKSLEKRKAL